MPLDGREVSRRNPTLDVSEESLGMWDVSRAFEESLGNHGFNFLTNSIHLGCLKKRENHEKIGGGVVSIDELKKIWFNYHAHRRATFKRPDNERCRPIRHIFTNFDPHSQTKQKMGEKNQTSAYFLFRQRRLRVQNGAHEYSTLRNTLFTLKKTCGIQITQDSLWTCSDTCNCFYATPEAARLKK